jgi:hypothetical protein
MFVIYGIEAALACFWNLTAGNPVPGAYTGAACTLSVISFGLLTRLGKSEPALPH